MLKLFKRTYNNKRDSEIEIFFKHVNWYKLLRGWNLFPTFIEARDTIDLLKREQERIRVAWHNNPHYSLGELLTSMEILPITKIKSLYRKGVILYGDSNPDWYFSSIDDLMELMGIPAREHKIWASQYNIFGCKRKFPKVILIKDMSTWHIKRVLKNQKFTLSYRYSKYFKEELERRKK